MDVYQYDMDRNDPRMPDIVQQVMRSAYKAERDEQCDHHSDSGWFCNRARNHEGPHMAFAGDVVAAIWTVKKSIDQESSNE